MFTFSKVVINAKSFAAVYLWKDFYLLEYTVCEDMLIFRTTEDGSSYSFPIGDASPEKALLALEAHCKENEEPLKLHCVYRENEAWLEEHMPGKFEIEFAFFIYLSIISLSLAFTG